MLGERIIARGWNAQRHRGPSLAEGDIVGRSIGRYRKACSGPEATVELVTGKESDLGDTMKRNNSRITDSDERSDPDMV